MVIYKNGTILSNSAFPNTDFTGNADFVIPDDSDLAKKIFSIKSDVKLVFDNDGQPVDVIEIGELIDIVISKKKIELSAECEEVIISGVDVGNAHYSLTITDQANILGWTPLAEAGKSVPYHADGEQCRIFTAEEFLEVAKAATFFIMKQRTYCNLLMRQVEAMTNVDDIKAVHYGITELTGEYAKQYQIIMSSFEDINT